MILDVLVQGALPILFLLLCLIDKKGDTQCRTYSLQECTFTWPGRAGKEDTRCSQCSSSSDSRRSLS